jgi:hypothetical protein
VPCCAGANRWAFIHCPVFRTGRARSDCNDRETAGTPA